MKLTNLNPGHTTPAEKPKRSIYGGTLYHGNPFSLSKKLFGHSPNVIGSDNRRAALDTQRKEKSRYRRISTNEVSTVVSGTIEQSIREVGLYPVQIVVDHLDGSSSKYLVTL